MIESPLLPKLTGYIGGRWSESPDGNTFDVYNPATGEVVASVASMSESEVYKAVEAGKSALRLTSPYSIETRRKIFVMHSGPIKRKWAAFCAWSTASR